MSDAANEMKRLQWPECCGFTKLFRSFRMAIHWPMLCLAFVGIILTSISGKLLDTIWVSTCMPAVSTDGRTTEVEVYIASGADGVAEWIKGLGEPDKIRRVGTFDLFLKRVCSSTSALTNAVIACNITGILGTVRTGFATVTWLMAMHPGFAIVFGLIALVIWSLFGGALCRVAALRATRDERIGLSEAMSFARERFLNFLFAPLMPAVFLLGIGIVLFGAGIIGWIPAVGEVIIGLFFFLALMAGFVAAFVMIGALGGFSMTFPTIAVEGSDAFDAFSRTYSYVYQRPWRTTFYMLLSIIYGAICLLFVKIFTRVMLWSAHFFIGLSMNWGSPRVASGESDGLAKLDTIWRSPAITGEGSFWGSFGDVKLAHMSWFAQLLFRGWIYVVWALVVAFAISFFYSASTVIYLLLRREVDLTDMEDVYFEELPAGENAAAPPSEQPPSPGAGTSLPVIS